jgi:dTDP-4-dehydrorhamnose 3,5-epimerase
LTYVGKNILIHGGPSILPPAVRGRKTMNVEQTKLEGVLLVNPAVFEDHRGEYVELYNAKQYAAAGIRVKFIQDDLSASSRHVLRGIHGDSKTWKLVSCLAGSFYLVIVNCEKKSKRFGAWQSFTLSERNRHQVLVPPNHGVAHLALSDRIIFHYKQSTYYDPSIQFTYRWDEPQFKIWWPIKNPILSQRDECGRYID